MRKPATAERRQRRAVATRVTFVVYLALVLVVTMTPSPEKTAVPAWQRGALTALQTIGIPITFALAEALANVVMFIPFGIFVTMLLVDGHNGRLFRPNLPGSADAWAGFTAGVLAFTVSGVIETIQLVIPGRVASLQDVVLNGIGGVLGAGAAVLLRRRRRASMTERDQ